MPCASSPPSLLARLSAPEDSSFDELPIWKRIWAGVPHFWKFHLAVWAAYGFGTLPIHVIVLSHTYYWHATILGTVEFCLLSCVFSVFATAWMRRVILRFCAKDRGWAGKLWLVFGLAFGLAILKSLVVEGIFIEWLGINVEVDLIDFKTIVILTSASVLIQFSLYTAWGMLYLVARARHTSRLFEQRAFHAERAKFETELQMLRAQIQPHFLYNALNSMACETNDNPRLEKLIQSTAEYLRYGLVNRSGASIKLGDEIDAITQYLHVEQSRYGNDLQVKLDVDPACLEIYTPGVLIQPLIENAIKYGRATSTMPLIIQLETKLEADDLTIRVSNTGSWVEKSGRDQNRSSGVGMENLKARLELLYPGKHTLVISSTDGWVSVAVSVQVFTPWAKSDINHAPKLSSFL